MLREHKERKTMAAIERGRRSTACAILVVMLGSLIPIIGQQRPWPGVIPHGLLSLDVATRLLVDPESTAAVATDFGRITTAAPAAVFCPSSDHDIAALLTFAHDSPQPFPVAPRGQGHSVRGQASAPDGVVIDMASLRAGEAQAPAASRIRVSAGGGGGGAAYVDAGGEQLWVDVLHETVRHGLAPASWTDYLHLTVGGTLSNGGVSGQAFRFGPQISNVYELDVVTGRGEMITCSKELHSDLFFAVLGGLGQFGVIVRARIALRPAPEKARWVRLIYTDFRTFTEDQEFLISLGRDDVRQGEAKVFDYVEGSVFLERSPPAGSWRSSFYSAADADRISSLAALHGAVYCLEGAMYYDNASASTVDQAMARLLGDLSFEPGFVFSNDIGYVSFLDRVHQGELSLRSKGLWDVPHPWLNVFVPKSRILDWDAAVFRGILRHNHSMGPVLVYPLYRDKWDERMSSVIPDEDIFYSVGLLWSAAGDGAWERVDDQNEKILRYCEQGGIGVKQYLPHYKARSDWVKHFGRPKWDIFLERKRRYDPRRILSPGQGIFSPAMP